VKNSGADATDQFRGAAQAEKRPAGKEKRDHKQWRENPTPASRTGFF